jgi:hypothetical protein
LVPAADAGDRRSDGSRLQLALAAADHTSAGTAVVLSLKEWSFMSVDLKVNMTRPPVGEWVGVRAQRSTLGEGIGMAASAVQDDGGVFGRCTQTQLLQRIA